MRASMSRGRIAVGDPFAGSLGVRLGMFTVLVGIFGCGQSAPPAAPAKPVAGHAARESHGTHDDHDHDHDHGKDGDHEHGKDHGTHDDHDDHADHDHVHPETLAAGVAELETMWGHVKGALKAGDREKADAKVHAVGHLLEDFESLLAKEKTEAQEAGRKATEEVFDCFGKLDEAFHGDEDDLKKLDVDALGERLEAAITTLKGLVRADAR
jgi:hypothetical protein